MRYPSLLCLLCLLLCTCGRAPTPPPLRVAGTIRYDTPRRLLQATLELNGADSTAAAPFLAGTPMRPLPRTKNSVFQYRRESPPPAEVAMSFPCPTGPCQTSVRLPMVSVDSLPSRIFRQANLRVTVSDTPLRYGESIVFFFEPLDRSAPQRIQFLGPSQTGTITLKRETLEGLEHDDYDLYLVRQGLARDSTAHLQTSLQTEYISATKRITVAQ